MGTYKDVIGTIDNLLTEAKKKEVIHLETKNDKIDTNIINLGKGDVVHFGSCSYLGLEFNEKMKAGSIDAINKFGTQFSSSRAYVSISLYKEYEDLLSQIFEANVVVTPTTTLGHISVIPNQVNDNDAVILDHQVHSSVQNAVNLLKPRRIHVELLRHNNMKRLEERIQHLLSKHDQVWYMADGIYSMYGDGLPTEDVERLLNKYKNFRLYVDDAHGMSWAGKHGRGYTLSKMDLHPQMILATSMAKGFGSGGGVLVFPTKKQADLVRNCGGPMVTSGPLQPANLGAGIAGAKLHLTDEIYGLQEALVDNIRYTNLMLQQSSLPVIFNSQTPIFFIGTSLPKIAHKIIHRMHNDGFYVNLGMFPAVPMKNTGIRFTITKLHTFDQIEGMVNSLAKHYHEVMKEENFDISRVYSAFRIKPVSETTTEKIMSGLEETFNLKLDHHNSITEISKEEWNTYFENRGTFDWDGLKLMEESFSKNIKPEDNWDFDYVTVRDKQNKLILATFFTTAINKDDMLAPESISVEIEIERKKNPYYLTSKTLFMGSLFSEGEHLYLDQKSNSWKGALNLMFEKINEIKTNRKAVNIILRDFTNVSEEFNSLLIDNGYYQTKMPNSFALDNITWENEEEFLANLSGSSRRQIRKHVLKHSDAFTTKVINQETSDEKLKLWYGLYKNVKKKSLNLNTFTLPYKLFKEMALDNKWEKIELAINNDVVAIVFCYKNDTTYNPMLIGLNYEYNSEFSCYRQALHQLIKRAKKINMNQINLGFSADIEKKRFGAKPVENYSYLCTDDTFNQTVMSSMNTNRKKESMAL